ncbi:hypothetical protein SUNI508_08242 [Seiridium unicorne]|uniref:DUF4470 domain-containing protein n=1 Tax=Seiridium unicorne TaxID=138068 RepID=A0ABR2UV73_9PEZI
MFNPAIANYITQFYALGNTPAVDLTRGIPHGEDADILLLGCGDARNILLTTHSQQLARRLDITCCDISPAILARNVFLFLLIAHEDLDASIAWSVYYELYLGEQAASVVQLHVSKLLDASTSLSSWRDSQYNQFRFPDEGTLQLVRGVWSSMSSAAGRLKSKAVFEKELQRSQNYQKLRFGNGTVLTGLRSAAPTAAFALQSGQLPEAYEQFWKSGTVTASKTNIPNPLFSSALSENTFLHYGTDPILGFHLATAFAGLAPTSPLRADLLSSNDEMLDVVRAAKVQFAEWVTAFRVSCQQGLVIRFVVADAVTFCHILSTYTSDLGTSTNTYRHQLNSSRCELDAEEYGTSGIAPRLFDVIDTSNLADHVGPLNLLVAAKPLLKNIPSSAIFTETLLKTADTRQAQFDTLLCGHGVTVSLLLGLSPIEYWTNATSVSSVDELLINSVMGKDNHSQVHTRLSWKLGHHLMGATASTKIHVEPDALANVVTKMYREMFGHEKVMDIHDLVAYTFDGPQRNPYPFYHRGSLAAFLKLLQNTVDTDWPRFYEKFTELVSRETVGIASLEELYLQLQLHGIYTASSLRKNAQMKPSICDLRSWPSSAEAAVFTLVVPRVALRKFYDTETAKFSAPTLQIMISSGEKGGSQNVYLCLLTSFGHVVTHGNAEDDEFSISVEEDSLGWSGNSPLVVSFYVSASILQFDPKAGRISLGVQPTTHNLMMFKDAGFGPDLVVFGTTLADSSCTFVTKHLPGTSGKPVIFQDHIQSLSSQSGPHFGSISVNIHEGDKSAMSLTGHVDVTTELGKKLLTDKAHVKLEQPSPSVINIIFGKNALVVSLHFPLPVLKEGSQTRIARKSSYVEVIAPIANPLDAEPLADFIYPVVPGPGSLPMVLNGHHLNLDKLPIIDVEEKQRKKTEFMRILIAQTFSVREKRIRQSGRSNLGFTANQRLNLKESIFTMFMISAGLPAGRQSGQTGLFLLSHAKLGGIMYIFVPAVRLDGGAGSVVLDAAILPLTLEMVNSGELNDFFVLARELEHCAINVNDEELRLWRCLIPAFVERCRTWSHKNDCEYKRMRATIPLSQKTGEKFLCSCGNGKLPDGYMQIPEWESAAKYSVRAAISPTFSVPFVEDIIDIGSAKSGGSKMEDLTISEMCRTCGKAEGRDSAKLMACSRCSKYKDPTDLSFSFKFLEWM